MTPQEKEINGLILPAEDLAEKTRTLCRELYQHAPRREIKNPPSLATLMSDTGHIAYRAAELREEIRKVHERRQRDEVNSNS